MSTNIDIYLYSEEGNWYLDTKVSGTDHTHTQGITKGQADLLKASYFRGYDSHFLATDIPVDASIALDEIRTLLNGVPTTDTKAERVYWLGVLGAILLSFQGGKSG